MAQYKSSNAAEHNKKLYDTAITSSRKQGLERHLQGKMGISPALARQMIRSYELKTSVNDESVKHIDSYLKHKEPK